MKRLITAAAISVTLFVAGCSSDATPSAQADAPSTDTPSTDTPTTQVPFDGLLLGSAGGFDTVGEWTSDNGSVNIVDDIGNNVNSVVIPDGTATPDAPWNRNFQHVVTLTQGESYTIKFKAKSDRDRDILVGIGENAPPWANIKESVTLSTEWQDFEVTLAAADFGGADVESRVFFELANADGSVLIDDVSIDVASDTPQVGTGSVSLPVTFEDDSLAYTWEGFDGGQATIIDNPQTTGNSSTKVTQLVKGEGQPWAGSFLTLDTPIDFTQGELLTVNFWSASLKPVLVKLEGSLGEAEVTASHTGSGTWESLEFDFTSLTSALGDVVKVTVIVENGAAGDGSADWTFYADDFAQGTAEVTTEPTEPTEPVASSAALDFETATTTSTWAVFENDDNPALEIIANPVSGDGNTSATVAKFTARQAGQPWAGTETAHGAIGPFILSADESTIKILVYKTVISDVGIKLVTTSGGALGELKVPNTVVNQWEELTFDFSGYIGQAVYASEQVDQVVVFPDYNLDGRAADTVSYFDDISFGVPVGGETPVVDSAAAPTDSAATPPARTASDVISVYGEAYAATAGLNYNPDWGQSGVNDLNDSYNPGDGDLSLAYVNFNYQGTELAAIDASAMEYLHVDIWVPEGTDRLVKVSPINNGTGAGEVLVTVPVTPGAWNSVDLPKSAFTGMTWDSVLQMKFDGQFNGDGSANTESFDVYLDNIYFHKTGGDTTPVDEDDTTTPDDGDTNLVTDGDFAAAGEWTSDNGSVNIIDDNGNSVNSVTIPDGTATPDAPWNRNFQQVIPITQGESYTVMFKAMSDRNRSIFVGIGLNQDPWTNVKESVALTPDWQDFEVTLTATDFGGDLNRVFFELAGEDGLVVIDDISIVGATATVTPPETPTGSVVLPVTFEDAELAYTWTDFDGGEATIIDNPQATGNTSAKVTQLVKGEGQPWAGSTLALDTAVDFTQGDLFTVNFWSASLKPVLLKLEGSLGNVEITVNHTGSSEWELLEFDFSNLTSSLGDVVNMTVIVENGAIGDGSADWTFYVDDIEQSVVEDSGVEGVTVPVDFESESLTFNLEDFDGGAATIIDNPQMTGNSSSKVLQLVKGAGAVWAGSVLTLDSAIDFTQGESFTMNFWSASAKSVLFKFEGTGGNAEVSANHSGGSVWESLTFDFAGQTAALGNVVRVVMIVDLGNEGDGSEAWTFYADDIAQSAAEPSSALATIQAGMNDAAAATWSFGEAEALNKVSISTSTTAYEGSESLRFMHNGDQDWGGFFTVFSPVLDQSSKTNLTFALSNVPDTVSYLGVKLESDGAGTDSQLNILNYTPVTSGDWDVYSIPLADFVLFNGGFNPAVIKAIGFWNPTSSGESAPPYVAVDILIDGINFE